MAAGDILSCTVLATGWEAQVVISLLSTGGTYAMDDSGATLTDPSTAKVVFTVVSEGYDASGALGTKTRTVYGTRARMKAYPNHATAEEAADANGVTVTLALSDYIYDDDNTGSGKSGTAPTVTIGAGFYTQGGTPSNATTSLAVTNNSTQDYPKVVARWAVVPYQRVTSTFDLEAVAFHRFAESGKPVACVVFSHTDASTDAVASTAMVKSSAADSLPCYKRTITASDYTDDTVYNWQFTAYPWVGDADSTLTTVGGTANALTLGPLPLLMDSDSDYPVYLACVNTSTGNDTSGVASTTYATANASPCATVNGAMNKIATATGGGVDAAVIYLQNDNHSWGDGTDSAQTTTNVWLTVTRDPNVAKANACIVGHPDADVKTNLMRLYDLTLKPDGGIGYGNAAGRTLWCDEVDTVCASQEDTTTFRLFDVTYYTFCTFDKLDLPCANNSTSNIAALIRGCTATNAKGFGTTGYYPRCVLTTSMHHANSLVGSLWDASATNSILAYSQDWANPTTNHNMSVVATVTGDVAIVCNVLEHTTTEIPTTIIYDSGTTDASNVLIWHNTCAGGRSNVAYNWTTNPVRAQFSAKFNAFQELCTKHDEFAENATYINAWSFHYGVGCLGNHSESIVHSFPPKYGGIRYTQDDAADYTDDNSYTTSGTGDGTYTTVTGSPLRGKIVTTAEMVIPWDLAGVSYGAGGDAGAYTHAIGGGQRFWSYS